MVARVNYRKLALEAYPPTCAYCGFGVPEVLEVAHLLISEMKEMGHVVICEITEGLDYFDELVIEWCLILIDKPVNKANSADH